MSGFNPPFGGPGMSELWANYDGIGFSSAGKPGGGGYEFDAPEPPPAPPERKVDRRVFLTVRLKPWEAAHAWQAEFRMRAAQVDAAAG